MRRDVRRFLLLSLASLTAVPLAFACGTQEVTIPDQERRDGSSGADSAKEGAASDSSTPDASLDVPIDVVCPEVLPDDATGIYVAPTGVNNVACGTRAAPCKTLEVGITHAVAASRPKVNVSRGTYVERVALTAGIEIVGGWDVTAGSTKWRRACVTPEEAVVVRAPAGQNITVEAIDLGGEARLSLLRIDSKAAAQVTPGESLYGVVAVGATTTLVMTDVHVDVSAAGAGASAPKGVSGVAGGASCPAGTGLPGAAGGQGAGAAVGDFDIAGYQPEVAASGTLGSAGANGTAAGLGTCVTCGKCDAFALGCTFIADPGPQTCAKDGTSGCGGGPGAPGGPATGGGSSVGVYAWDATVTINGGKIKSGDAGSGGSGGAGGNGGAPSAGAVGAQAALCVTACTLDAVNLLCLETKTRGIGGAAGGPGALGGAGGGGGGGGGGSSFATFQGNVGLVTTTASTNLAHGKAGAGGGAGAGAGAPGAAADHVP